MNYQIISDEHISSLPKYRDFSLWQSLEWKCILLDSHHAKEAFYFWNINTSVVLVEIRKIGGNFLWAFALWVKHVQFSDDILWLLDALKSYLKKQRIAFLQIEPLEDIPFPESTYSVYKKFLTPFTRVIDLEKTEEELFAEFHTKGRRNVRVSKDAWVDINFSETMTAELLASWELLLHETTLRDKFAHNSTHYYQNFCNTLKGKVLIASAQYRGVIIAMAIITLSHAEAIYYYGASTSDPEMRKLTATFLLQWETIQYLKTLGIKTYDLFGIADPNDPNDTLAGVSFFKQRLWGHIQELPKKYLYPTSYTFKLYRWIRALKKYFE